MDGSHRASLRVTGWAKHRDGRWHYFKEGVSVCAERLYLIGSVSNRSDSHERQCAGCHDDAGA